MCVVFLHCYQVTASVLEQSPHPEEGEGEGEGEGGEGGEGQGEEWGEGEEEEDAYSQELTALLEKKEQNEMWW